MVHITPWNLFYVSLACYCIAKHVCGLRGHMHRRGRKGIIRDVSKMLPRTLTRCHFQKASSSGVCRTGIANARHEQLRVQCDCGVLPTAGGKLQQPKAALHGLQRSPWSCMQPQMLAPTAEVPAKLVARCMLRHAVLLSCHPAVHLPLDHVHQQVLSLCLGGSSSCCCSCRH